MTYTEVRPTIKSGELLAWSHRGWKTWHCIQIQMVRFFTQSEYSHVGIAWVVGGRVLVLEAVQPKVRIYPLSSLGDFYLLRGFIPWSNDIEEIALSQVGKEYSKIEAIASFFNKSINTKWQCAKYVQHIAECAGRKLFGRATPSSVVQNALMSGCEIEYIENKETK